MSDKPKTFEEKMMLARATYFMTHPHTSEANLFQGAYEVGYSYAVEATRQEMQAEIDRLRRHGDILGDTFIRVSELVDAELKEYGDSSDMVEIRRLLDSAILKINQGSKDEQ